MAKSKPRWEDEDDLELEMDNRDNRRRRYHDDDDDDDDYDDEPRRRSRRRSRDIGQDAGMRLLLPVGRSPWAIIAGYLGLLSPLVIFAPLALIVAIVAIMDIKANPEKHGMGRAIFGLVMGLIFSGILVFSLFIVMLNPR